MLSYNSDLQEIRDRLDNLDKLLAEMRADVAKSEERHRLFLTLQNPKFKDWIHSKISHNKTLNFRVKNSRSTRFTIIRLRQWKNHIIQITSDQSVL